MHQRWDENRLTVTRFSALDGAKAPHYKLSVIRVISESV